MWVFVTMNNHYEYGKEATQPEEMWHSSKIHEMKNDVLGSEGLVLVVLVGFFFVCFFEEHPESRFRGPKV